MGRKTEEKVRQMKQGESLPKLIRDIEIQKEITYEWLDLFRTLSSLLIKYYRKYNISFSTDNTLLTLYEQAGIILSDYEVNNISSSIKEYMASLNEFESVRTLVRNLMISFKLELRWFLSYYDKNHIENESLDYISDLMTRSQKAIQRLEKHLSDENLHDNENDDNRRRLDRACFRQMKCADLVRLTHMIPYLLRDVSTYWTERFREGRDISQD